MKKSKLFIGNDSGLMHLAVASKLSTIALFGPTNDKIYGPVGENCFIIRTEEKYLNKHFSEYNQNESYMDSINLNSILNLIEKNNLL